MRFRKEKVPEATLAKFGNFILNLRNDRGISLSFLGEKLNVSKNHLSLIERGLRPPSDILVRNLARFYSTNETELFHLLGRIPLSSVEELNDNHNLAELLSLINENKKLSVADREKLYTQLREAYLEITED